MHKSQLQMALSLLLVAIVAACGGGNLPAKTTTLSATAATTNALSFRTTAGSISATASSIAINVGGAAVGAWVADTGYSSTGIAGLETVHNSIDTSHIFSPAPQAVYQTQRYATHLTYTIPNLTPRAAYTVRMHFVESVFAAPKKRIFDVKVNGVQVLTDFDIFQSASGENIAIADLLTSDADAMGKITIALDASVNNASIAAIEIAPAAVSGRTMAIDAGGSATGNWIADTDYQTTGNSGTATVTNSVNTSLVSNPAPQSVYQTQRWARGITYTIPGLSANAAYNVRLHLVESYWTAPGKRLFNATMNGARVLTNFDIFQAAGGTNIAIAKQFTVNADATGEITIQFVAAVDDATIAGIEISSGSETPTPAPLPTASPSAAPSRSPISFYTPTASAAPTLALNPNPMTRKICASDPCSPVIDSNSSTYNTNWFGSTPTLPVEALRIPGNSSSIGYSEVPLYAGSNTDPSYNMHCVAYSCYPTSTLTFHIPNGAHANTDHNFELIDASAGTETGGWKFNTGCSSCDTGTTNLVHNGYPNPLWSYLGSQISTTCFATNTCKGGASEIPMSSNLLDPVELLKQNIPHMLRLLGHCVTSSYVYPAVSSDAAGPAGCIPMGEVLWLDKTDAQIEVMSIPRWVKTLYHNLHDYGWIDADSIDPYTKGPGAHIYAVDDYSWTAVGKPSQWTLMFNEMRAEGTMIPTIDGSDGPYYQLNIPTASGITVSNFHWLRLPR